MILEIKAIQFENVDAKRLREKKKYGDTIRNRDKYLSRNRHGHRDRQRHKHIQSERQKQIETETDRQTDRDRDRETFRQRQRKTFESCLIADTYWSYCYYTNVR